MNAGGATVAPPAPAVGGRAPGSGVAKGSAAAFDTFLKGAVDAAPRAGHRDTERPSRDRADTASGTASPSGGSDGAAAAGTDASTGAAPVVTDTAVAVPADGTAAQAPVAVTASQTAPVVESPVAAPASTVSAQHASTATVAHGSSVLAATVAEALAPVPGSVPRTAAAAPSTSSAAAVGGGSPTVSPVDSSTAASAVAAAIGGGVAETIAPASVVVSGARPTTTPAAAAGTGTAATTTVPVDDSPAPPKETPASRTLGAQALEPQAPEPQVPGSQTPVGHAPAAPARSALPAGVEGVAAPAPVGPTGSSAVTPSLRPKLPAVAVDAAPAASSSTATPTPAAAPTDRALPPQAAAPAAAASTPPPLTSQLARPVFTLAAAGSGEHVMTVHVTPDTLGPVTVRAHVGGEGVRVELFAPTDAGRDALRAILPDLRRDLSGAGLSGSLDLSSQNQPSPQHDAPTGGRELLGQGRDETRQAAAPAASTRSTPPATADGSTHTIDLIV